MNLNHHKHTVSQKKKCTNFEMLQLKIINIDSDDIWQKYSKYSRYSVHNGVCGEGMFENFCVKSHLTVCKVIFNCKLQKKLGEQHLLVAPPVSPVPAPT